MNFGFFGVGWGGEGGFIIVLHSGYDMIREA